MWKLPIQIPSLISLSLLGEEYLDKDIAIALCSLLLNKAASMGRAAKGEKNILDMGALGALNALAKSDEEELQVMQTLVFRRVFPFVTPAVFVPMHILWPYLSCKARLSYRGYSFVHECVHDGPRSKRLTHWLT